ncbi:MAG: DUF935 domain-containing protein [Alphaproteobacteria bacterium]
MPPTNLSRRRGLRHFKARTESAAARPNLNELSAKTGGGYSDVGAHYGAGLAGNPDDLVQASKGGGLEVYEKVLTDDQVFSNFQQRRLALISKEVDVQPGGTDKQSIMAADFVREMISGLSFDRICNKMAYGLFYGYGIGECLWARDGRHWTMDNVKVRKAKRFRYSQSGDLMLLTQSKPLGEKMEPRKFWTFESGSDNDDNPYGVGLGAYCYWPSFFKRNGVRYWILALEKFGAPTAVGKYPANATKAEKQTLLEAAAAFTAVSGLAIPDTMQLELLGVDSKVGGNHDKMVDVMDRAISKVIVGQTMTTDDGSSNAQAGVHENTREDLTKADVDLQCGSFRDGPLKWLMEWNYSDAAMPLVTRVTDAPEDLDAQADRDTKLYAMGWEPTEARILETYGDGYARRKNMDGPETSAPSANLDPKADTQDITGEAEPSPEFEAAPLSETSGAVDRFLNSEEHASDLETEMDELISKIETALEDADSPEAARAALLRLSGVPQDDPFATRLALAGFNARLHGRAALDPDEQV